MMRAKFQVQTVTPMMNGDTKIQEQVEFMAVSSKPFDAEGKSEDNDFARWTPSGKVELTIQNPALFGKFEPGQKFYADFTPAAE